MAFMAQVNCIVGTSQTSRENAVVLNLQQTNRSKIQQNLDHYNRTSVGGTTYDTCVQRGTHIFGIIQQLSKSGCMHVMKGLKMMD